MACQKELYAYKKSTKSSFSSSKPNLNNSYSNSNLSKNNIPEEVKKNIIICIGETCSPAILDEISKIIYQAEKGKCTIYLTTGTNNQKLEIPYQIDYDEKIIKDIGNIIGAKNVTVN